MLLAIDVGNTTIAIGVFEERELVCHWRVATRKYQTPDEYGIMFSDLSVCPGIRPDNISGSVISSVVPPLTSVVVGAVEKSFRLSPMIIGPDTRTGVPILTDNPKEVGADRIANAVAAFERFSTAAIIIDFGTATTFDCVSREGYYLGGAIAPGIGMALDALHARTAMLPHVKFAEPCRAIGRSTIESIQSGVFFGYMGMIENIVLNLKEEFTTHPHVIATGGDVKIIADKSKVIDIFDEFLTLNGLRLIYGRV